MAQQRFVIDDASKVGEARRAAQTLASLDFSDVTAGKVAIVATELANNLLLHAGGGELLLQTHRCDEHAFVELLAIDKGPGMQDVQQCLRDGFSTAGTAGQGLGAVRRLADDFDLYSQAGEGTVVMARLGKSSGPPFGAVSIALEGEFECGDGWHLAHDQGSLALLVVDGLGHGAFAAEAARTAISAFRDSPFSAPKDQMSRSNALMSKTRGGAAACAVVSDGKLSYAGVGNIAGSLVSPGRSTGLVSQNGTLGMGQRRVQQFEYRVEPRTLLIMHSDGVSARWDLKHRPELMICHPAVIAGVIYRDHGRERDDSTIVVVAT